MTKQTESRAREWHVRRQRPDSRTTLLWFIDADADRMSFRRVLDDLASDAAFRSFFLATLVESEAKTFVLETPRSSATSEFECALTEVPAPRKIKVDPSKYAAHFGGGDSVAVLASPDGNGTLVVPRPEQVEGWYADLGTFLRRIREAQQHAVLESVARAARTALATAPVCLSSSAPGAPWLHWRVGTSTKGFAYTRYAR